MSNPEEAVDPGFGERLKQARLRAGFTSQPKLARALGLNPMTVHRHESQGVLPKDEVIKAYAGLLKVPEAWLRYGLGDVAVPPAVEQFLSSFLGIGLEPAVAERLKRLPWSLLTAGEVDEKDVARVARAIEKNLAKRRKSADEQLRRVPRPGRDLSRDSGRAKHPPSSSHRASRARS
jgi:transcriptional regulator with XRE-family HTH domain